MLCGEMKLGLNQEVKVKADHEQSEQQEQKHFTAATLVMVHWMKTIKMMKTENKILFVPIVVMIILALSIMNSGQATTTRATTTTTPTTSTWTTGRPGVNLNGKMFTLSFNRGGISFYSPNFSPLSGTRPYPTVYTTNTYPPWTTSSPNNGVSVCLRYVTDYVQTRNPSIFTLSPSKRPLKLRAADAATYILSYDYGNFLYLAPNIRFWSNTGSEIWTRVCLTLDSRRNVVQVFSGPNMSIRKMLPTSYVWSGEPVIDFSGFDGQVTDVQVWDYPLRYREVYSYMNAYYWSYSGSVLSWSYISYTASGNALLEDVYQQQGEESINGRETEGEKKTRLFFNKGESMKREQQPL